MEPFQNPKNLDPSKNTNITGDTNYIVIGKIPGYNTNINKNIPISGAKSEKINFEDRLKNNLTTIRLRPTGYHINFDLMQNDLVKKALNALGNTTSLTPAEVAAKAAAKGKGVYEIGANIHLGKVLKDAAATATSNQITLSTTTAVKNWQHLVQGNVPSHSAFVNELRVLATNDSTMTEVFSNDFQMSTAEKIANSVGDWKVAKTAKFLKKSVTVDSNTGLQMLSNSDKAETLNLLAGKILGIQTSLPKEWFKSDYSNSLQLMIKLVSPSGDDASIQEYILKPLKFLILATAPITFDGINFGYPTLWEVLADGMMDIQLAGISAMTITRGGAETQFNRFNQPLNIDVRLTIEPLINGFAALSGASTYEPPKDGVIASMYKNFMVPNPGQLDASMSASNSSTSYKTIKL